MKKKGVGNSRKSVKRRVQTLKREQRSNPVREGERLKEIESYLGMPSIGPPTIRNTKAHKTNRL